MWTRESRKAYMKKYRKDYIGMNKKEIDLDRKISLQRKEAALHLNTMFVGGYDEGVVL